MSGPAAGPAAALRLAGSVTPRVVQAQLGQMYRDVVDASTEFIYVFSVTNMSAVSDTVGWGGGYWDQVTRGVGVG